MMLNGETVLSGTPHPKTPLEVLESGPGFYLGFRDKTGCPYSRETCYFNTRGTAEFFLSKIRGHEHG